MAGRKNARPSPVAATAQVASPEPAAPKPDTPGIREYPVLSPLRFNRRLYRPGDPTADVVEMTAAEAAPLQALNVLGEAF